MKEYGFYDPVGVTKSRICCLLANSAEVREAIDYRAIDPIMPYDPTNPMTLLWNCIVPVLVDPDTITTKDPQILVGIETEMDVVDPRIQWLYGTVAVVLDNSDLRTNVRYVRKDLLDNGILAYTKADYIAYMVKKALSELSSETWIGDIEFTQSTEGAVNNALHYGRTIKFRVREVNPDNRGV